MEKLAANLVQKSINFDFTGDSITVIAERSHPELNKKENVMKTLRGFTTKGRIGKYFVSFQQLPKFGLKPMKLKGLDSKSEAILNTPYGVFAYPLTKQLLFDIEHSRSVRDENRVNFSDRKYIFLIELNTDRVLNVDSYSDSDLTRDLTKVMEWYPFQENTPKPEKDFSHQIRKKTGEDEDRIKGDPRTRWEKLPKITTGNSPFQTLMYTLRSVGFWEELQNTEQKYTDIGWIEKSKFVYNKRFLTQNRIFRELGYDALLDTSGQGVIHWLEKTQIIFLHPRAYKIVNMWVNPFWKQE